MLPPITPGRLLLTCIAASLVPACFIADWNKTHMFNPSWPPHAKFHNGQTISMGVILGLASLYYVWRDVPARAPRPNSNAEAGNGDSTTVATVLASVYFVGGLVAWFFPGALAVDPEFGEGFPQLWIFGSGLIILWVGRWLELSRLEKLNRTATKGSKGH